MERSLFAFVIATALSIYMAQRFSLQLPLLVRCYANDLLCVPIVLELCRKFVSYFLKIHLLRFNPTTIVSVCLYFSIYFEYWLPESNSRYTGDWIDVVLYFLGGMIFFLLQRKEFKN